MPTLGYGDQWDWTPGTFGTFWKAEMPDTCGGQASSLVLLNPNTDSSLQICQQWEEIQRGRCWTGLCLQKKQQGDPISPVLPRPGGLLTLRNPSDPYTWLVAQPAGSQQDSLAH